MPAISDELTDKDDCLSEEYENTDAVTPLPEGYREEMLKAIVRKTGGRGRGRVLPLLRWVAAASVVLAMAGWWLFHQDKKKEGRTGLRQELAAVWIGRHNTGKSKVLLQLPDSSRATLSPGTTIRYRKDFGHYDKREVKVEGQALFEVTRNKQMPFVVYSEGLHTTVLGTVFEVIANKESNQIRVRLLEGKVMVGLDPVVRDSSKDYYLSPGEEFVFNKDNNKIAILNTGKHGGTYATGRVRHLPVRADSIANWYMFNNQTLADVFDQLSAIYNVEIQYSREDLRQKYFIGRLERIDSLHEIIRDIALLNHLSVNSLNGRYIIKRRK
jgi:transmembrane sensor